MRCRSSFHRSRSNALRVACQTFGTSSGKALMQEHCCFSHFSTCHKKASHHVAATETDSMRSTWERRRAKIRHTSMEEKKDSRFHVYVSIFAAADSENPTPKAGINLEFQISSIICVQYFPAAGPKSDTYGRGKKRRPQVSKATLLWTRAAWISQLAARGRARVFVQNLTETSSTCPKQYCFRHLQGYWPVIGIRVQYRSLPPPGCLGTSMPHPIFFMFLRSWRKLAPK